MSLECPVIPGHCGGRVVKTRSVELSWVITTVLKSVAAWTVTGNNGFLMPVFSSGMRNCSQVVNRWSVLSWYLVKINCVGYIYSRWIFNLVNGCSQKIFPQFIPQITIGSNATIEILLYSWRVQLIFLPPLHVICIVTSALLLQLFHNRHVYYLLK